MGEVERVHGTYNSTFGHDFRHRVDAASKDKQRRHRQEGHSEPDEDVIELHEDSGEVVSPSAAIPADSEGIDFSA